MIAEALEFLKNLKDDRPIVEVVGDATFAVKADRTLGDVVRPPAPIAKPTLILATLTGLVDAFNANVDGFSNYVANTDPKIATAPVPVAVHVEGYDSVALVSLAADEFGRRHVWLRAKSAETNPFQFGVYYSNPEDFLIAIQASFVPTDNLNTLLRVCSNLTAGSSVSVADDGFSQKVTLQDGGVTRQGVEIPPRVSLAPYRTFREVSPIESDFLIRMRGKKDALPEIALFPVDCGRWKHDTALAVKAWMQAALPAAVVIA